MSDTFTPPAFGWIRDDAEVKRICQTLEDEGKQVEFANAAPALMAVDDDSPVFFWEGETKVLGKILPSWNQKSVGSCVSFGYGRAAQDLLLGEIVWGDAEEWPGAEVATEPIYGGSRVEVGGGRIRGDGSVGAWAAKWVKDWGILLRKVYGRHDLTTYSESLCRQYGSNGCPDDLEPEARLHPVTEIAKVSTAQELWAALGNWKPVSVCSDRGFTTTLKEGFCEPSGSWAHCVLPETIISGERNKRADKIREGDKVYGSDGDLHAVTEIHTRKFKGNLVTIAVQSGTPLVVTEDHPVLVYRNVYDATKVLQTVGAVATAPTNIRQRVVTPHGARFAPVWTLAKYIRPNDYLVTPGIVVDDPELPEWPKRSRALKELKPFCLDADIAYMLGFYIGDGNIRRDHGITFTLSPADDLGRIVRAVEKFGVSARIVEHENYRRIYVDSVIISEAFEKWFGKNSKRKRFPSWLLRSRYAVNALYGLVDADGCFYKGIHILTSVSRVLIEQVRMLLISLGMSPTCSKVIRGRGAFANASPSWEIRWREVRKHAHIRIAGNLRLYKVKSVLYLPYEGDVYNYEVEDTHDYVADGYVVHNCMTFRGRFISPKRGKSVVIQNSWGGYLSGDSYIEVQGVPEKIKLPEGCFATTLDVAARMCQQDDTFALAGFTGWKRRKLDWTP